MKTIKLILLLLAMGGAMSGQDSLRKKELRHQIGVDLTSFVKYYVNFGSQINPQPYPGSTPFYVQYRYHLKSANNLRAGIGGTYSKTEAASTYTSGPAVYINLQQALNFRLGFEHYENLTRRFQVFYGLDLIAGFSHDKNDAQFWNRGYANGYEHRTSSYGVAVLAGLRLYLTKRLSIFTESNLLLSRSETSTRKFYAAVDGVSPPKPDDPVAKNKSQQTTFNLPLFVVLAVDF